MKPKSVYWNEKAVRETFKDSAGDTYAKAYFDEFYDALKIELDKYRQGYVRTGKTGTELIKNFIDVSNPFSVKQRNQYLNKKQMYYDN
jgi:hypothetical protein